MIQFEVEEEIDDLEIWGIQFGKLATRVEFEGYGKAVDFANQVFELAEQHGNYPVVKIQKDAVEIDVGQETLTEEDLELAEKIEQVLRNSDWC